LAENTWASVLRVSRADRVLGWTLGVAAVVWVSASLAAHLILSGSPEQVVGRYLASWGFEGPIGGGPSARFVIGVEFWSASVGARVVTFGGLALLVALRARRSAAEFRSRIETPTRADSLRR
jgi:hypothetical protein